MKVVVNYFLFITLYLLSCPGATASIGDTLKYNVSYVRDVEAELRVEFAARADADGRLELKYENATWGDNDIFNCLGIFEVLPQPERLTFDREKSRIIVKTIPHQEVQIRYAVRQDFKGSLKNHHRYRPIINRDYFHILGMRLFVYPENVFPDEDTRVPVAMTWKKIPGSEVFHSSFGAAQTQYAEVTREEWYASFFVGGDFRKYELSYKEKPVYFLTRGNWVSFTDEEVCGLLEGTISAQYDFWKDGMERHYAVSLLPTSEKNTYSIGGSGLTASFISFASNNEQTNLSQLTWLYHHELLHKWLGRTIKNKNEVEQYWFSEGFTDYYAYKLMLKSNRIDAAEFVRLLNKEVVGPHYANKDGVSTIPNTALTFEKYWSQYGVYGKLPYRRGLLYAFLIDNQIRRQSNMEKSLDDLMHELLDTSRNNPAFRLDSKSFKQVLSMYLPKSSLEDFDRYILQGDLIDFSGKLPEGMSFHYGDESTSFNLTPALNENLERQLSR